MSNAVEVLLFDHTGRHPVQIEPQIEYVTWRLNGTGNARLFMSYSDANCLPHLLAFGNRILIQFENGLPSFGGVLDVPRRRTPFGVSINAYTGDRILSWRYTGGNLEFSGAAPGIIYRGLIDEANGKASTGIYPGSIYVSPKSWSDEYRYQNVLSIIQQLQQLSGEEWSVEPHYEMGHLSFRANWYKQRGQDLSHTVSLIEGHNVREIILDEQGPIASQVYCVGGGSAGSEWTDRNVGVANDATSRSTYGYREYVEVLTTITDPDTLDESAVTLQDDLDSPRSRMTLQTVDKDPSPFGTYGIGDVVVMQAFLGASAWVFEEAVRVLGIEWRPNNECRVEVY